MADNFTANAGAGGDTFAADDIAGVKFPRGKITLGADGVDGGDVSASNPLPVSGTFWQATQPVSADALPLPSNAAQETGGNLASIASSLSSRLPSLATSVPSQDASAQPVRPIGQEIICAGFSAVGSSVLDSTFNTPIVGTGVGYSQAAGSLAITAGTTTNAEFLARSVRSIRGAMRMRFTTILSQRVANNNFVVMLGDLVGETLSYTINSAVSVSVTLTAHGFTSQNVGQFCNIGGITGAAGVPGRYAIASIPDANTINFTVSGWPASGSGTCSVFGRNYIRFLFNGTTATAVYVDAQRNGWATGDTTAAINTTASPGTMLQAEFTGRDIFFSDSLRATSTTPNVTTRASRYENIPDSTIDLYAFIWSFNGTVAPTATTWTLGHLAIEDFPNLPVYLEGVRAQGLNNPLPVQIGSGTVTTVSTVSTLAAISAGTNAIGDVGIQYRASATGGATPASILSPATPAATSIKASAGRLISLVLVNSAATVRSVKFWNTAVGSVTLGTTAAIFEIDIPPSGLLQFQLPGGIGFATAITYAVTGAKGLTDNTAITANDVSGFATFA